METDLKEIGDVLFRTTAVYAFLIVGLLAFGKRELSQLNIIDLIFILLISNSVQNAMVGNSSTLSSGLVSAGALFLLNFTFKKIISISGVFRKFVEGKPVFLIYDGKLNFDHLKHEMITETELLAAVREHGVEKITDVKMAILETDGNISVIPYEGDSFHRIAPRRKSHPKLEQRG